MTLTKVDCIVPKNGKMISTRRTYSGMLVIRFFNVCFCPAVGVVLVSYADYMKAIKLTYKDGSTG